jgi:hypothetical protein
LIEDKQVLYGSQKEAYWVVDSAESLWLAMREGLQRKCRCVALLVNNQLHTGIGAESPTRRGTPEYKFESLALQGFRVGD